MVWIPEAIDAALHRILAGFSRDHGSHLDRLTHKLNHMEHRIMSALGDLKSAIADLSGTVSDHDYILATPTTIGCVVGVRDD